MATKIWETYIGKKFGKLTVVGRNHDKSKEQRTSVMICKCECGNISEPRLTTLKNGRSQSCGCGISESNSKVKRRLIHGKSHTRLWRIWKHMQNREYGDDYNLQVCEEWLDFEAFEKWALANGYKKGLTIERIDVYGDYEPSNCKWITRTEQLNNTTRTLWYVLDGEEMSLKQAYNIVKPDVTYTTVKARYHKGIRNKEDLFKSSQYRGKQEK